MVEGALVFADDGLFEGAFLAVDQSAAVEVAEGELHSLGRAEAFGEAVGGVVLVELSGGDVPSLRVLAADGSVAECSGDSLGGVAADLADSGAAVVAEAGVDVGELGLHRRAALFRACGPGPGAARGQRRDFRSCQSAQPVRGWGRGDPRQRVWRQRWPVRGRGDGRVGRVR